MTESTANRSPLLSLNNGVEMPALGLGVFLAPPEQTAAAVETAIATGYRLVDTAAAYNNERQVGEGVRRSGIDRGEIFVTTKLWVADYGYDAALRAFDASLRRLGFDYIDLYLLHWPVPADFDATIAAYRAAEKLLAEGRARAIGVSNFLPHHLEMLMRRTDVVPAVNQVELHPYFTQQAARDADQRHGIVTQSWSPIGGVYNRGQHSGISTKPLESPVILQLAAKLGKTPAQIILRWHLDHGFSAIPKSVTQSRIAETGVAPAVNQIEMHPSFANGTAGAASTSHGVAVEAWSPLGQGRDLGDPVIGRIAPGCQKSVAQVILRWHIQHGHIVIPKTMHRERMEENFNIFDFNLSSEEMASIDALDRGEAGRRGPSPDSFDWVP